MAIIDEMLKRAQANKEQQAARTHNRLLDGYEAHEQETWRDWKGNINTTDLATGETRRRYLGPNVEKKTSKDSIGFDLGQAVSGAIQRQGASYKNAGATLLTGIADIFNGKEEFKPKVGSALWRMQQGAKADMGVANQLLEDSKYGHGKAYGLVMDLTSGAVDLASDALLTAATGGATLGGTLGAKLGLTAGLGAMGVRSFGGGAMEASEQGKSTGQQFLSGLKSATIEMLTEKIGGPFEGTYGKTLTGGLADKLSKRLAGNVGAYYALNAVKNFTDEGVEEMLSDVLNPLADKILKLDNGEGLEALFTSEGLSQMAYDGLIGGILGLLGTATEVGKTEAERKAHLAERAAAISDGIDSAMAASQQGKSIGAELEADKDGIIASAISNQAPQQAPSPVAPRTAPEAQMQSAPTETAPTTQGEVKPQAEELNTESEAEQTKTKRIGEKTGRDIAWSTWFGDETRAREAREAEGVGVDASDFTDEDSVSEPQAERAEASAAAAELTEAETKKLDAMSQEQLDALYAKWQENVDQAQRGRGGRSAEYAEARLAALEQYLNDRWNNEHPSLTPEEAKGMSDVELEEALDKARAETDMISERVIEAEMDERANLEEHFHGGTAYQEILEERRAEERAARAAEKTKPKTGADVLAEQASKKQEQPSTKKVESAKVEERASSEPDTYDPASAFEKRDKRAADLRKRISDTKDKDLLKVSKTHFDYAKADIKDFDKGRKIIGRSSFGSNNQEILEAHLFLINAISEELEKRGLSWADVTTRDGENAQITKRKIKGLTDQLTRRLSKSSTGADILVNQAAALQQKKEERPVKRRPDAVQKVMDELESGKDVPLDKISSIPEIAKAQSGQLIRDGEPLTDDEVVSAAREAYSRGNTGEKAYKGKIAKGKIAEIVMGLPGSGKSSVFSDKLSKQNKARIIDTDDVRGLIRDYNGTNAAAIHKDAQKISRLLFGQAINLGENIILSTVGQNEESLRARIALLKELGYTVNLRYVDLPNAKAILRALGRYFDEDGSTGRFVDPKLISLYGDSPKNNFEKLISEKGLVDGYSSYNNDVGKDEEPILTASSDRGGASGNLLRGEGSRTGEDVSREAEERRDSIVREDGRVVERGEPLDLDQIPDRRPDYSRDEAEFQAMQEKADREKADAAREAREKKDEDRHTLDEDVQRLVEEDRHQPNLAGFKKEQNKIEKIERELGGKQAEKADEYNEMMAKEAGGKARNVKQEKFDKLREEDKKTPTSAEAERDARKKERVDKVVSEEEAKVNFETASRFWGAHHRAVMDAAKNVSDLETFIDKGDYANVGNKRDQSAAKTLSDFRSQMNGVANGSDDIADLFYTYETFKNSTVLSEFYDADVQRMIDAYNRHADERSPSYNPDVLAEESARIMSMMAYRMKQANEWHDIGVELNSTIGSRMSKAAQKLAKSKKLTSSLARAFVRWQINPDTVFKMIDGFSGNKNSAGYKLAQELKDGVKKHYEVLLNARSHFNDLVNQEGYLDFAFGKEKIKDSEGREWDARTAVDLIRGVQTLLSTSEEKIDGIKGFALRQDDGSYEYIDFGEPSGPEGAMNYDNAGAEAVKLAKELSGKLSKVAKNYSKAASKAFESVTEDLKRVYRENVGEDIGMMGDFKEDSVYHPVWWKSPDSDDTVKWTIRDSLEGRWTPRFLHSRSETGGAYLVVRPVTDTIQNYFDQASNYIAYSAFANKMNFLNRDSEHKASLSRSLAETYGKDMGNWMTNYVDDISSFFNEDDTDGINALLRQSRRAIQQGALLFSVSVPMKQISSYWAASSILHMDSLAHAYRLKILKPLNSPGADAILGSRRLGNYDQSAYEAQQDAKKGFGKLKYKYPFINWASNTISMMDYNTVSNLLTATEYDVLKYQFGGDKSKVGTEAYNNAVKDLFQEVVLRSQPVFDKQMRAEYGRTDNELIRMSSMFRTQQTQNLNLIATAIGEYKAAKGKANEAKATERLKQTIEGQVASALSLSILSILADFALHKFRKYRDDDEEEDPITVGQTLERLGINAVASASSTLWFGDTLAKWAIDQLSGGKTNEFYGVNLGVVTTLSNVIDSVSSVVQQPTRSNVKYAAGQIATMLGIPLNNAYSLLNSAIMYAKDATGTNEGNYDDILRYLDAQTKAAKKAEAKAAKEAAKAEAKSGADMLADTAKQNSSQSELNSAEEQKETKPSGYLTKPYNALVEAGMSSQQSQEVLTEMDTDGNNSVKQSEMIAYWKAHPEDEQYVMAMWNSYGYKTTWEKAKQKAG